MLNFSGWKIFLILFVSVLGPIYALPNILNEDQRAWMQDNLPPWMPHKAMNLGLDLQGGSHLQLQVDMATVLSDRVETLSASVRQILRDKKISVASQSAGNNQLALAITQKQDTDQAVRVLKDELGFGVSVENNDGVINIAYTKNEITNFEKQAIAQSIEIIRRRIDETGTKEPIIQAQGKDRIIVQLPGMKDPERVKQLLGKTARMTFHLVDNDVPPMACNTGEAPISTRCLPMSDEPNVLLPILRRALLTGDMLVDARPDFDISGRSVVNFRFDSLGARKFADITRDNVNKRFAVVLDD